MAVINTRSDLDELAGTPEHAEFLAFLAGTLYRLERDDDAQTWRRIEDDTTIERFGFTRADFPDVQPPEVPKWIAPKPDVPQAVSRFQARAALHLAGLLPQVESLMAADGIDALAKLAWQDALVFERSSPTVAAMTALLGLDDAAVDALFRQAEQIKA